MDKIRALTLIYIAEIIVFYLLCAFFLSGSAYLVVKYNWSIGWFIGAIVLTLLVNVENPFKENEQQGESNGV